MGILLAWSKGFEGLSQIKANALADILSNYERNARGGLLIAFIQYYQGWFLLLNIKCVSDSYNINMFKAGYYTLFDISAGVQSANWVDLIRMHL